MTTNGTKFVPGLEGVVAFHTGIAEPDRTAVHCGTAVSTSKTWSALSASRTSGRCSSTTSSAPACRSTPLPPAFFSGDVRVDVQASLPLLAPARGFGPLLDITDEQARDHLAQTTSAVLVLRGALRPR